MFKTHPILGLVNSYIGDSPQPANISYIWNFGSLLGCCLIIQIITGVTLAMHYTPSVDLAFISVEHIIRDVEYGWLIRYLHANVASFFFYFCISTHWKRAILRFLQVTKDTSMGHWCNYSNCDNSDSLYGLRSTLRTDVTMRCNSNYESNKCHSMSGRGSSRIYLRRV